jgi:hypothetical protein
MSTYDHKHVFVDYANGKITPEMAVGHSLQHIGKLYEVLAAVTASRTAEQAKVDALEQRVHALQTAVDRLTAFMQKVRRKSKQPNVSSQPKPDQP